VLAPAPCLQPQPDHPENGAWDSVRHGWRLLFGSFSNLGCSLEFHSFTAPAHLRWDTSFHPDSFELCLNLRGSGCLRSGKAEVAVEPGAMVLYRPGSGGLNAWRLHGEDHCFLTLEVRPDFLTHEIRPHLPVLSRKVRETLDRCSKASWIGEPRRFTLAQENWVSRLVAPPVAAPAQPLWYQGQVLAMIADFFAEPAEERFCDRQKRLVKERVARAREIIEQRFVEGPTLDELARAVGVSPFYLSRMFSAEVGQSIPQYLRRLRMERAAELLRAGSHNVTEAAFAVGYASLGHFSKSFCEVIGCCPALYPHAKNIVSDGNSGKGR
jgi:AraC-like DNA-binding protein